MTFKKINENEQQNLHDRSCMILVNFNAKELAAIKTVSNFAGIRDRIAVTSKNGNTKINDILDGNMLDDNEEVWSEKAIIFNNILLIFPSTAKSSLYSSFLFFVFSNGNICLFTRSILLTL